MLNNFCPSTYSMIKFLGVSIDFVKISPQREGYTSLLAMGFYYGLIIELKKLDKFFQYHFYYYLKMAINLIFI